MIGNICKIFLICISLCLVFGLVSCNNHNNMKLANLYVQEKSVECEHTFVCKDYATIPLVITLEALGFGVAWEDDHIANLTYGSREYVLNLTERSLIEKNGTMGNVLIPAPGSDVYSFEPTERDIIIDVRFFQGVMYLLKMNVYVDWDVEERNIHIKKNTNIGSW